MRRCPSEIDCLSMSSRKRHMAGRRPGAAMKLCHGYGSPGRGGLSDCETPGGHDGDSPHAEFISLWVQHDRPASVVALSVFHLRCTESDEPRDLAFWVLGGQVNVHSALCGLRFGNSPEQDPSNSALIGGSECRKIIFLGYGLVTGHLRPEGREPPWIGTIERDVFDERRHRANLGRNKTVCSDLRISHAASQLSSSSVAWAIVPSSIFPRSLRPNQPRSRTSSPSGFCTPPETCAS